MYGGKKMLAFVVLCGTSSFLAFVQAQQTTSSSTTSGTPAPPATLVRDPLTGRLFQQQVVNVQVPTTTWESKPVTQTVYEPRIVTSYVPQSRTVYAAHTQYVLQSRVRGRWNPFRRETLTYRYVPVTTWVPTTQTVSTAVSSQQWVAKQQTVMVAQPVQRMTTQQQVVQTEVPQPGVATLASRPRLLPARPLARIPLLARQRVLPWAPRSTASPTMVASSGLRPIAGTNAVAAIKTANYSAPLRTASNPSLGSRDAIQSGMAATVLR